MAAEEQREPNQIPQATRNLFNKGFTAFERGNLDFAIELLLKCVELAPGYLQARKYLRMAEIATFRKARKGALAHTFSTFRGGPGMLKVKALQQRGRNDQALMAAEHLLTIDPLNARFVRLFAEVAEAAGQIEAAIQTMELAQEYHQANMDFVQQLGELYRQTGNHAASRDCFERLVEARPRDPKATKLLKDAMALGTIGDGRWKEVGEKGSVNLALLKNKEEALNLEREGKAVKSATDAEALIKDAEAKIAADPSNINYYRGLARLYSQQNQFEEALATLEKAKELTPNDPDLDRSIATTRRQSYDYQIGRLHEAGQADAAAELEAERNQFMFDNLQERVDRYPTDLRLKFELGRQYLQYDYVDEAIQQLQLAQRSPKDRVMALYLLGQCFRKKDQNDMAVMQLESALESLVTMDEQKKDVVYALGELAEDRGDWEKAAEYFKEIYRHDISYKDISEKVERAYAAQKQQSPE